MLNSRLGTRCGALRAVLCGLRRRLGSRVLGWGPGRAAIGLDLDVGAAGGHGGASSRECKIGARGRVVGPNPSRQRARRTRAAQHPSHTRPAPCGQPRGAGDVARLLGGLGAVLAALQVLRPERDVLRAVGARRRARVCWRGAGAAEQVGAALRGAHSGVPARAARPWQRADERCLRAGGGQRALLPAARESTPPLPPRAHLVTTGTGVPRHRVEPTNCAAPERLRPAARRGGGGKCGEDAPTVTPAAGTAPSPPPQPRGRLTVAAGPNQQGHAQHHRKGLGGACHGWHGTMRHGPANAAPRARGSTDPVNRRLYGCTKRCWQSVRAGERRLSCEHPRGLPVNRARHQPTRGSAAPPAPPCGRRSQQPPSRIGC